MPQIQRENIIYKAWPTGYNMLYYYFTFDYCGVNVPDIDLKLSKDMG